MKETNIPGCPFCGGEAALQTEGATYEIKHVFCECKQCGARGKWVAFGFVWKNFEMAKREAIEHWSNRKPMERIVERLEEAKGTVVIDGKEMYQEDYFIDIDEAIKIVKEEGKS